MLAFLAMSSEPVCLVIERLRSGAGPTSVLDGEALAGAGASAGTTDYISNVDATTCSSLVSFEETEATCVQLIASQANTTFLCAMAPNQTNDGVIVLPPASDWVGKTFRFYIDAAPTQPIIIVTNEAFFTSSSNMSGVFVQRDGGGVSLLNNIWKSPVAAFFPTNATATDWIDLTSYGQTFIALSALVGAVP